MAFDTNLADDIRSGAVVRHAIMTISNDEATIRTWSGRGELVVDGVTYGDAGDDVISISGLSDTVILQSHEVEISIGFDAARKLDLDGFSARNASVEITTIFLAGDGSVRDFRKVKFKGSIQSSRGSLSLNSEGVVYRARPPLLDLTRDRMTRYTPPDQARRFGSTDTGFDDVPGLVNKEPVEWSPSASGTGGDINVQFSVGVGGVVTLTDTSGREVVRIGTSATLIKYECGATDRLGFNNGNSKTVTLTDNQSGGPITGERSVNYYNLFGYGSIQDEPSNRTADGLDKWLLDFVGAELMSDGFVYAGGSKVVVSPTNNKIYSSDGFLLVNMYAIFADAIITAGVGTNHRQAVFDSPPHTNHLCSDIDQTPTDPIAASVDEVWSEFNASIYLQAQVQ